MKYREFGRTGWRVSEIGFGAWAIGSSWGDVPEEDALEALNTAIDNGVNFIDTADAYGGGRSERLIAQVLKERDERVYVATKAGRKLNPHVAEGYNRDNLNRFVDESLERLQMDSLDLLQLHCPPTEVYYNPAVFEALDEMVEAGKLKYYGVSVEKVEEALKAIEYPNVASVQIIFNMFRLRPSELFFREAMKRKVAILARVPLASGLLTGKITPDTTFPENDHRNYNRHGERFDVGETLSGVEDLKRGYAAVQEIEKIKPEGITMAQFALKWITMFDAVNCPIPGAKNEWQARDNAQSAAIPPLTPAIMARIEEIYDEYIRDQVHYRW